MTQHRFGMLNALAHLGAVGDVMTFLLLISRRSLQTSRTTIVYDNDDNDCMALCTDVLERSEKQCINIFVMLWVSFEKRFW